MHKQDGFAAVFGDGKKEGPYEYYYENGQLKRKTFFINDKIDGPYEEYYNNGQLKIKTAFKQGKYHGALEMYFKDGQLQGKGALINGEYDGTLEKYYKNGQLKRKLTFKNGVQHGPYEGYFENGQLRIKTTYQDGLKNGTLEKYYEQMEGALAKELNLIIRADVQGSVEALIESIQKIASTEVKVNIVHSATGAITESDIMLAAVSNAIVFGFNVRPNPKVRDLATEQGVDIRFYDVIYNVINDIKGAMVGLMEPTYKEHIVGRAETREIYNIPKVGTIAGSYVTEGKIERGQHARLLREGVVVYDGKIASLRRFKDDAKEVQSGYECGIGIENYNDVKVNDVIECYEIEEIEPVLE